MSLVDDENDKDIFLNECDDIQREFADNYHSSLGVKNDLEVFLEATSVDNFNPDSDVFEQIMDMIDIGFTEVRRIGKEEEAIIDERLKILVQIKNEIMKHPASIFDAVLNESN